LRFDTLEIDTLEIDTLEICKARPDTFEIWTPLRGLIEIIFAKKVYKG